MAIASGVCLVLAGCSQLASPDAKIPRITKEELKGLIGSPKIVILDVRVTNDWKRSHSKIKGAFREDPEQDSRTWGSKYPKDKTLVFYCA
jgi:rhodanese-related sulfurtransferase